jgi:hypothetical protein
MSASQQDEFASFMLAELESEELGMRFSTPRKTC